MVLQRSIAGRPVRIAAPDEVLRTQLRQPRDAFKGRGHEHFESEERDPRAGSHRRRRVGERAGHPGPVAGPGFRSERRRSARRDRRPDQRRHRGEGHPNHERRRAVPVRLRRVRDLLRERRADRVQDHRAEGRPRPAARRRHRGPQAGGGRHRGDGHRHGGDAHDPVQHRDPRPHDRAGDGEGPALRRRATRCGSPCSTPPPSSAGARSRPSPTTTGRPTRWTSAAAPSTATTSSSTARRSPPATSSATRRPWTPSASTRSSRTRWTPSSATARAASRS